MEEAVVSRRDGSAEDDVVIRVLDVQFDQAERYLDQTIRLQPGDLVLLPELAPPSTTRRRHAAETSCDRSWT